MLIYDYSILVVHNCMTWTLDWDRLCIPVLVGSTGYVTFTLSCGCWFIIFVLSGIIILIVVGNFTCLLWVLVLPYIYFISLIRTFFWVRWCKLIKRWPYLAVTHLWMWCYSSLWRPLLRLPLRMLPCLVGTWLDSEDLFVLSFIGVNSSVSFWYSYSFVSSNVLYKYHILFLIHSTFSTLLVRAFFLFISVMCQDLVLVLLSLLVFVCFCFRCFDLWRLYLSIW